MNFIVLAAQADMLCVLYVVVVIITQNCLILSTYILED